MLNFVKNLEMNFQEKSNPVHLVELLTSLSPIVSNELVFEDPRQFYL